jgi:glycosyltransferase involved in cell wall biosynthesis
MRQCRARRAGVGARAFVMRILHVTTFLQGGAGRIIAALAVAQRRAGHAVDVVADAGGAPGYGSYPEYLQQLADAGVAYHAVRSTFTRDVTLNVAAARQVRAIAGTTPPEIVHTHAAIPTLVACLAHRRRGGTAIVQTMHGWGIHKTAEQAATDIALLDLADAVATPSAAARDTLHRLGLTEAPVHVIPYGIEAAPPARALDGADAALFAGLRAGGGPVALCIGTFGERKNQALLVAALAQVPALSAVFIGDGEAGPIVAAAAAAGVAERVHVLGYRPDASRYLPAADMLVLPSRNEGLPIAVLEALRAGVPVVGSALPEIAEAVDDGVTGCLFAPDDAAALAALSRVAAPEARTAMGRQARAAFAARYALPRMIGAYDRLYRAQAR